METKHVHNHVDVDSLYNTYIYLIILYVYGLTICKYAAVERLTSVIFLYDDRKSLQLRLLGFISNNNNLLAKVLCGMWLCPVHEKTAP